MNDRCGITVAQTAYGPGHVARPRVSHYPLLSTAAPDGGSTDASVVRSADRPVSDDFPVSSKGRGRGASKARITAG